mmetsp:Transcript_25456/g.41062  ORF Transcript_25456/g.41062 Transcript_25456/m.41062 type:complete len:576 (-) Transcript_25456:33-1760(-)
MKSNMSDTARCFSCASPHHISSQCPRGLLCMNCKSPDHLNENCPLPDFGNDIRHCYTCGGVGHIAKTCTLANISGGVPQQQPLPTSTSGLNTPRLPSARGNSKYRSSSMNSSFSYDSNYSGFGNHWQDTEDSRELYFESPYRSHSSMGMNNDNGLNRMTPPIKREQPSPFQPISSFGGFQQPFSGFEEKPNVGSRPASSFMEGDPPVMIDGRRAPSRGCLVPSPLPATSTNRVQPTMKGKSIMFDPPPGYARKEEPITPPGSTLYDSTGDRQQVVTPQPGNSSPAATTSSTSAKKKKRKKKKKKAAEQIDGRSCTPDNQEVRCYNCDQVGHLSRDCTIPRACFLCGEFTHVAKQCKFSALVNETPVPAEIDTKSDEPVANLDVPFCSIARNTPTPIGFEDEENDENNEKKKNICLNCNEVGHRLKNCPYGRKCFQCGNVGHVARECPNISERIRMLQKKRSEENPSPQSLGGVTTISANHYSSYGSVTSSSGGGSPFLPLGSNRTCSSMSSPATLRPTSCSPQLIFGGNRGAFSSFVGVPTSRDPSPLEQESPDQDPQLQDFVSNLLTDLDLNEA